jgi:hypothetical protein
LYVFVHLIGIDKVEEFAIIGVEKMFPRSGGGPLQGGKEG